MSHYVCKGTCGGVNETPNTCGAEGCPKNGEAMMECNCEDSNHAEVMGGEEASTTMEGGETNADMGEESTSETPTSE
jgi:hypothetical protein